MAMANELQFPSNPDAIIVELFIATYVMDGSHR